MARLQAMRITVKDKNKTIIFAHFGSVSQRWIGFSEDDAKNLIAEGAGFPLPEGRARRKSQAAKPHLVYQRVEDNAFHRFARCSRSGRSLVPSTLAQAKRQSLQIGGLRAAGPKAD